jgi:hypothetical protein
MWMKGIRSSTNVDHLGPTRHQRSESAYMLRISPAVSLHSSEIAGLMRFSLMSQNGPLFINCPHNVDNLCKSDLFCFLGI